MNRLSGDAGSLRCPSCGAPAAPDAARCAFCRTRLATISCPSCFARLFADAVHCHACGARRDRTTHTPADASCPGCSTMLQTVTIGAATFLECRHCDGVWVDADVFERISAEASLQAAVLHHYTGARHLDPGPVRYRPCVRCGRLMNRINFGRVSGVIVDVCKGHGTFLDPGELHCIVEFIRGGGLERARARQVEELRHREQAVRRAETRLAKARGRLPSPSGGAGWSAWRFFVSGPEAR